MKCSLVLLCLKTHPFVIVVQVDYLLVNAVCTG